MPRLGVQATVRSSSAISPGTATVAPTGSVALGAQLAGHLGGQPGQRRLDLPHVGDGMGDALPDRAGQVEHDRRDVLEVGLEADADGSTARQREP